MKACDIFVNSCRFEKEKGKNDDNGQVRRTSNKSRQWN